MQNISKGELSRGDEMKRITTGAITLAATLTALCFVTGLFPYVFFLPVTVAATTLSVGMAAFVGLMFGVVSIIYSVTLAVSPVALAFIEAPYIAIFPRIIAALAAFGVYRLIIKFAKPQKKALKALSVSAAAATASLLNTVLVVGLFVLVMPNMDVQGTTMLAYVPVMLISGVIELVCMAVITPPITMTLDRFVLNRTKRAHAPITDRSTEAGEDAEISQQVDAQPDTAADGTTKPAPDAANKPIITDET